MHTTAPMNAVPFDYTLHDASASPVPLDFHDRRLVAKGYTARVYRCELGGRDAVVKCIENILDMPRSLAYENIKSVMDAEVELNVRVTALRITVAPAFYGVVRLRTGSVQVRDTLVDRWTYYLFMQYVPGETLREFLYKRRGRLQTEQAFALMRALKQTCDAFAQHGIVLQERCNPANIIVQQAPDDDAKYTVVFIDYQVKTHHNRTRDMFSRPAWLISVSLAFAQHSLAAPTARAEAGTHTKGGSVSQQARCILSQFQQEEDLTRI